MGACDQRQQGSWRGETGANQEHHVGCAPRAMARGDSDLARARTLDLEKAGRRDQDLSDGPTSLSESDLAALDE